MDFIFDPSTFITKTSYFTSMFNKTIFTLQKENRFGDQIEILLYTLQYAEKSDFF